MRTLLTEDVFLFPYSVLPESYYRLLALILPSVNILEFINPLRCPEWDSGVFNIHRVLLEEERLSSLKSIYKGYREFATAHGDKYVLEMMPFMTQDEEWKESRFYLQSLLSSGKSMEEDDPLWRVCSNALIFLELARDLDEKDIELYKDIMEVHALENEFRKSLGLSGDDLVEVEEEVKVTAERLPPRGYFDYLTKKRISSWFSVCLSGFPFITYRCNMGGRVIKTLKNKMPILICPSKDVVEELVEPIRAEKELDASLLKDDRVHLLEFPNILERISNEEFYEFEGSIKNACNIEVFWKVLEDYINGSGEAARNKLVQMAEDIQDNIESNLSSCRSDIVVSTFKVSLLSSTHFDIFKAWQYLDGSTFKCFEKTRPGLSLPFCAILIEEH